MNYSVIDITLACRAASSRSNWNDTEKISMAPVQGWHPHIEKCRHFLTLRAKQHRAASIKPMLHRYATLCMYVCMYVCVHIYIYIYICICIYVCMYICMYVCVYIYIYIYIHVYIPAARPASSRCCTGTPRSAASCMPGTSGRAPQLICIHIHQLVRIQYMILSRHCKHLLVVVYKFLSRTRAIQCHCY